MSWRFGGDGATCTISASIGSQLTGGKVRLTAAFHGCDGNWEGSLSGEDLGFTVIGYDKDDHSERYGGTIICIDPCGAAADIPFTGPGTYCGLVFYADLGYGRIHGHDPLLRPCRYITGQPSVFPPGEIPPPPTEPTQPPPVNPPPEIPCPQVSSLGSVPDGAMLQTCDTGRMYKMVGGAPLWMTTCTDGMCPGTPIKVTQAIVDAGRAYPRDAATARDEAGNVFKFVGGAPVHLSSCTVGCGTPVSVPGGTLQLVHPANHLRQLPVDGATARDEAGHIFKFVGGAPIHLSSCSVGCGGPVPLNGWSVANLDHMNPVPADGATARDEAGNVFKFVGGTPIHLSSCSVGCGNPVSITAWSIVHYEHMRPRPADGATARDEAGNVFKFVGGAPIHLSSCSVGCGNPVPITGWSVATLEHMNPYPSDGATARDEAGNVFKFVGGAPIHLSSCSVGCGNPVPITGWSVATLEHMNPYPSDGATARDEAGNVFKFVGGAPIHLSSCSVGCGNQVPITGWSVATLEHMRPTPVDGAVVRDERGRTFKFAGGAPLRLSTCAAGCSRPVLVTAASVDGRDHMNPAPVAGTYLRAVETGALLLSQQGQAVPVGRCPMNGCANAVVVNAGSIAEATGAVQTAFQANTGKLYLLAQSGGSATDLGMAPGTSPASAALALGGHVTVFQANTGSLWVSTPAGTTDTKLGMMPGTSPSVAALPGGGYVVAVQANTGNLWVLANGSGTDTKIGMKAGTSPAIAASLDGGYQIAVQANTGNLWTVTSGGTNTNIGMLPGTSPAITALAGGGYAVAVQANTGRLWVLANGTGTDTQLGMMAGTSPAIAAALAGGYRVAFHASTGNLWELPSGGGGTNTNLGMKPGTSPSITPATGGTGYTVAFHANTGNLWLHSPAGGTNTQLGMLPGTSPAAGTSLTWR
ncbi:hypothetical protein WEI85_29780 [Actinomycetes bacterium KLBMP 9797]